MAPRHRALRSAGALALAGMLVAGCATYPPGRIVSACSRAPGTWVPRTLPPAQAAAMIAATGLGPRVSPGLRDYWLEGTQGRWLLCRADLRRDRANCSTEGYIFVPVGDGWALGEPGWITVCGV